jgi:transcriptional regulator with XRE-family HTH domain
MHLLQQVISGSGEVMSLRFILGGMGMKAVGIYVGSLRQNAGLTQEQLANKAGISEKTLRNLESGRHEPKLTKLAEIVDIVRGSWVHVALLLKNDATIEQARRFINEAISGNGLTDEERVYIENLNPSQKKALIDLARQMQK